MSFSDRGDGVHSQSPLELQRTCSCGEVRHGDIPQAKLLVQVYTICQVLKRPLEGNETLASLCEVVLQSMADSLDELPKDLVDLCRKHVADNAVQKPLVLKTMRKFQARKAKAA